MQGRKRVLTAFLLCLLILLTALPTAAFAAETGENDYRVVVDDEADLLTEAEEDVLRAVMEKVLPYGNAAFVSVNQNSTTTERLAENKFVEFFGDTSGALLIIDMDNRYVQLITDGTMYKTVTRARCSAIADNVYTYATRKDYLSCAAKAFEQVVKLLEGQRISAPFRYVTNAFLALCLALLGNYVLMSLQRRRKVAPENALKVQVAVNSASSAAKAGAVAGVVLTMLNQRKTKHVESSGSGGRSGGGGFHGGGGGGGFHGGGGGHRF